MNQISALTHIRRQVQLTRSTEQVSSFQTSSLCPPCKPGMSTNRKILSRGAYIGWVSYLVDLRSDEVATAMETATVERCTSQSEWEKILPSHPWVRLLGTMDGSGPRKNWKWLQTSLDLDGKCFFFIIRNDLGVPVQLQRLWKKYFTVEPVFNQDISVSHYKVYYMHHAKRKYVEIDKDDILWFRNEHPEDPQKCCSVIEAAAYEIDIDKWMKIYRRNQFQDGGVPRIGFTTDEEISAAQARDFQDRFMKDFQGHENIGRDRPFVAGKGLTPKLLQIKSRDLEYVTGAGMNREDLHILFRVPTTLFKDDNSRAASDNTKLSLYELFTNNRAKDLQDELIVCFEDAFKVVERGKLRIKADEMKPTGRKTQKEIDEIAIRSGIDTIAEIRARDGKKFIPGTDRLLVNHQLQPLDAIDADQTSG